MQRISSGTAAAMIAAAVLIDLIGLIPFAGTFADIVASMLFGIWFSHYGVSVMSKRTLSFLGTALMEFIPGFDMLPLWTIFVIFTIRKERGEAAAFL